MRKNVFHVRFRRLHAIVPAAEFSEWFGPVVAPGPFVAAKQIVTAQDWSDLPMYLRVEVYDDLRDYRYDIIVEQRFRLVCKTYIVLGEVVD